MPDNADALAPKAPEASDDGVIVGKLAVTGKGNEIGDKGADIIEAVWPIGVPGDLGFLPGREIGIEFLELWAALASSREISSPIAAALSPASSARNSSILASISASGFSKSR